MPEVTDDDVFTVIAKCAGSVRLLDPELASLAGTLAVSEMQRRGYVVCFDRDPKAITAARGAVQFRVVFGGQATKTEEVD